jgi:type III pantothenate kinase
LIKLAIDIGNTRTKIGLFDLIELRKQWVQPAFSAEEIIELANQFGAKNLIISSVAMPDAVLLHQLHEHFTVIELKSTTPLPYRNAYATPETLGKDRLAAVAGADALFRGKDCMVIDAGTCIKYELFTEGTYRGGNIAPGLRMRTEAMAHFTARLPEVETEVPEHYVGHSTETALQNGAFLGALLEIMGFYRMFNLERTRTEHLQVILTGGDAAFLARYLSFDNITVEPNLTLLGLNYILDWNIRNIQQEQ